MASPITGESTMTASIDKTMRFLLRDIVPSPSRPGPQFRRRTYWSIALVPPGQAIVGGKPGRDSSWDLEDSPRGRMPGTPRPVAGFGSTISADGSRDPLLL